MQNFHLRNESSVSSQIYFSLLHPQNLSKLRILEKLFIHFFLFNFLCTHAFKCFWRLLLLRFVYLYTAHFIYFIFIWKNINFEINTYILISRLYFHKPWNHPLKIFKILRMILMIYECCGLESCCNPQKSTFLML